jgi:polyisoprenoid-binding protein YceI
MMHPTNPVSSAIGCVSRGWRVLARSILVALGAWAVVAAGGTLPAALAAATEPSGPATTQPAPVQYVSAANAGKATVAGTSSLHNWTVASSTINGTATFAGRFNPAAPPAMRSIQLVIPVNTLKSSEGGGMDDTTYDALKVKKNPNITYSLDSATLSSGPSKDDPKYHYNAKGRLTIAGWLRYVSLTLDVEPADGGMLTISAQTPMKMTDYGVKPPTAMLGAIKSGDDVTVNVTWQLAAKGK